MNAGLVVLGFACLLNAIVCEVRGRWVGERHPAIWLFLIGAMTCFATVGAVA